MAGTAPGADADDDAAARSALGPRRRAAADAAVEYAPTPATVHAASADSMLAERWGGMCSASGCGEGVEADGRIGEDGDGRLEPGRGWQCVCSTRGRVVMASAAPRRRFGRFSLQFATSPRLGTAFR